MDSGPNGIAPLGSLVKGLGEGGELQGDPLPVGRRENILEWEPRGIRLFAVGMLSSNVLVCEGAYIVYAPVDSVESR